MFKRNRKIKIKLDSFELNLLINGMNEFRNMLLAEDFLTAVFARSRSFLKKKFVVSVFADTIGEKLSGFLDIKSVFRTERKVMIYNSNRRGFYSPAVSLLLSFMQSMML